MDVREEAFKISKELGADYTIDARGEDPVEVIRELTNGNGADVVFECAGGSPTQGLAGTKTLKQAIESVQSGGELVVVSWFGHSMELNVDLLRERSSKMLVPRHKHAWPSGTCCPIGYLWTCSDRTNNFACSLWY